MNKLEQFRQARAGNKRRLEFDEEKEKIYDEVDELTYNQVQRDRLRNDDFVQEDTANGYVDTGEYEWESRGAYSDEEVEETPRRRTKTRAQDQTQNGPRDGNINSMFSKKPRISSSRNLPVKTPVVASAVDFDALIENVGAPSSNSSTSSSINTSSAKLGSAKNLTKKRFGSSLGLGFGSGGFGSSGIGSRLSKRQELQTPTRSIPRQQRNIDDSMDDGDSSMVGQSLISSVSKSRPDVEIKTAQISLEPVSLKAATPQMKLNSEEPETCPTSEYLPSDIQPSLEQSSSLGLNGLPDLSSEPEFPSEHSTNTLPTPVPSSDDQLDTLDDPFTASPIGNNHVVEKVNANDTFRFYWTDYSESIATGSLMLFGRSVKGNSASVIVRNAFRQIYALPKEGSTVADVGKELTAFFSKHGKTRVPYKEVELTDCFAKGKPKQTYALILAPFVRAEIPLEGKTYSNLTGANTSPIENFVISRQIMGPGWLDVQVLAPAPNSSWTQVAVECDSPLKIKVLPSSESVKLGVPKMNLMSIAITTVPDASQNHHIVSITARVFRKCDSDANTTQNTPSSIYTGIRPPELHGFPPGFKAMAQKHRVVTHSNERALLSWFFDLVQNTDPDMLVGHQLTNLHLNTLITRAQVYNDSSVSKLGRTRSWWKGGHAQHVCAGRMLVDLSNSFGEEMFDKCIEYSLEEMCRMYLAQTRASFSTNLSSGPWLDRGAEGLMDVIRLSEHDTLSVAALCFKTQMIPLSRQLTTLSGSLWRSTFGGHRSHRNEYLLMHEFAKDGNLIPDKQPFDKSKSKEKEKDSFIGGLVIDPVVGLHQSCVLVMDFNSLYPSIIQEYNICFTTVDCVPDQDEIEPEEPTPDVKMGLLPRLLRALVQRRQEVKKLMKNANASKTQMAEWDIRQLALKLTANSMYGCLGQHGSRFAAKSLAKLTTQKGRQALSRAKQLAEDNGMVVLYGDTDSVMIQTHATKYQDAISIGQKFKSIVNEQYKFMEIDIDYVFRYLFLYMKKKYASAILDPQGNLKFETRGLDLRRRNFSDVFKISCAHVLQTLFGMSGANDKAKDEVLDPTELFGRIFEYLQQVSEQVRNGTTELRKFLIRGTLNMDLAKYQDSSLAQAHVARKMVEAGHQVSKGDTMSWIVAARADENDKSKPEERSVTLNMIKSQNLQPDFEYYLRDQMFVPLKRLLGILEGFDTSRLADVLGVTDDSKSSARNRMDISDLRFMGDLNLITMGSNAEKFAGCDPLELELGECKFKFEGLHQLVPGGCTVPESSQILPLHIVASQVESQFRLHVNRYYQNWLECDDCKCLTRSVSTYVAKRCPQLLCRGTMQQLDTPRSLFLQMSYFKSLFDPTQVEESKVIAIINSSKIRTDLDKILQVCDKYLERSGFGHINIGKFFNFSMSM